MCLNASRKNTRAYEARETHEKNNNNKTSMAQVTEEKIREKKERREWARVRARAKESKTHTIFLE